MTKTRKLLLTLVVVGLTAVVVAVGVFSAFSSTTSNPGNSFSAGTVTIGDNDAGSALYSQSNAAPGLAVTKCITVTYSGSLPSTVKLYTGDSIGALGPYVNLKVEAGSFAGAPPSNMDCTGFTANSTLFDNTLSNFASSYSSWANGLSTFPSGKTKWDQNDQVSYRVTATLSSSAPASAAGQSTGTHALTWEAQNQ